MNEYYLRDFSSVLLYHPHWLGTLAWQLHLHHWLPVSSSYTSWSFTSSLHNIRQRFIFPTHSLSLVIGLHFPYTLITLAAVSAHVLCSSAPQRLVLMGERVELYRLSLFQGHKNIVWPFLYLHKPFTSLLCNPKLTITEAICDILFLFSESQSCLLSLPNIWQRSLQFYKSCLYLLSCYLHVSFPSSPVLPTPHTSVEFVVPASRTPVIHWLPVTPASPLYV